MIKERCCERGGRTFSNLKRSKYSPSSVSTATTFKSTLKTAKKSVECPKKISRSPRKGSTLLYRAEKKKFNLSQILQKQRERELVELKKSIALLKYYNCLLMLFMMLYTSSQTLASNIFQTKGKSYPQVGLKFIDSLLKIYQNVKKKESDQKLRKLSVNVLRMAPTQNEFERIAQFISRKVTLNFEKKKEIQMAGLNVEVQSFWSKVRRMLWMDKSGGFAEDMFDANAQRLCVKDFQELIQCYLSTQKFGRDWREVELLREEKTESHSFTVEFLLIEKVCTKEYSKQQEEGGRMKRMVKRKGICQIY